MYRIPSDAIDKLDPIAAQLAELMGELLYERLGRPDRLDFSMDHYKLFYFIPD